MMKLQFKNGDIREEKNTSYALRMIEQGKAIPFFEPETDDEAPKKKAKKKETQKEETEISG